MFTLYHADTCFSDYWSGHHLPHVCIPVYPMTLDEVKSALHSEVNMDAIAGEWSSNDYDAFHAAIDRLTEKENFTGLHFSDIDISENDDYSVYAYFIFDKE
jgi:hypothetical protein